MTTCDATVQCLRAFIREHGIEGPVRREIYINGIQECGIELARKVYTKIVEDILYENLQDPATDQDDNIGDKIKRAHKATKTLHSFWNDLNAKVDLETGAGRDEERERVLLDEVKIIVAEMEAWLERLNSNGEAQP